MRLLLYFLLLSCYANIFAQGRGGDSLRIIEAHHDSIYHIEILPQQALNGLYNLVIEGFEIMTDSLKPKRGIRISWPSPYVNGRILMVINPHQIFLKTEHDNPYPDDLYLIIDIDTMQYNLIVKDLTSPLNPLFEDHSNNYIDYLLLAYKGYIKEQPVPEHWTDKEIHKHGRDYKIKLYLNFCGLLRLFNSSLATEGKEIPLPARKKFLSTKEIRIVYSMEQYGDQLKSIIYK